MAKIRFSEAEIRAFLNDPAGPVAHLMQELGGRAVVYAKAKVRKATKFQPGKHGRGGGFPPLATMESIHSDLHAPGLYVPWAEISAGMAAHFLEFGTQEHRIKSLGDWSLSNYATGYFGPKVKHPGARPYPFLLESVWGLQGQV